MAHVIRMLLCLTLLSAAHAASYYVSPSGSDTNPGTLEAPFATPQKALNLAKAGDSVLLQRGATFRGPLVVRASGTEGQPLRLEAYGEGPKPEILGSLQTTGWQQHEGEVYRLPWPKAPYGSLAGPYSVYEYDAGRVPVRFVREKAMPTTRGRFFYDAATETLYVVTSDGASPSQHRLEVPVHQQLLDLTGRSWVEIANLAFLFGNCRHAVISQCQDVTVRNCASLFVGQYGNPNLSLLRSERIQIVGCFLYDSANCGVFMSDGSTRCLVSGCTIVKCSSNDGVTIHSGGRDANGVFQQQAGDHNTVENNVIGLCPEESIDITSGDYHLIQGNICYGNGNPGIIVGHGSDHIMIWNNISFGNARAGIHVSATEAEGARGENSVVQNLVYDNGYPGLEVEAPRTTLLNNTVVNSRERPAVRISPSGRGSLLRNNVVAMLDDRSGQPCLQFLGSTPALLDMKLDHNLFWHAGKPDGRAFVTSDGWMNLATFVERYQTGAESLWVAPGFAPETGPRPYYFLADGSPALDLGADAGLVFHGTAPDLGWKEHPRLEKTAPRYPERLIEGKGEDAATILALWGKK